MSYNFVLDTLFSNGYAYFGISLFIIISYLYVYSKFLKNKNKFIFGFLPWVVLFFWFMIAVFFNPTFLGFGETYGVTQITVKNDKVYVVDFFLSPGSRYSGAQKNTRIHIIDAKTGNKIRRFLAGEDGDITGIIGDSLIFHQYNSTKNFSVSTGKKIALWNNKTLPKIFPQLSSGIDHVMIGDEGKILEITSLDGNNWVLNLRNGKLSPAQTNQNYKFVPSKKLYINNYNEIEVNDVQGGRTLLSLDGIDGNQDIKYFLCHDSIVNPNLKFLDGQLIAISEQSKCLVVLSYATTKKEYAIFTGVSLDGKQKIWEITQNEILNGRSSKKFLTLAWFYNEQTDTLYLALKTEVLAVQISTGKIIWKQSL